MYDVIVIGGGVIGGLIARELTKYRLKILIVEAKADVSMGASGANSGIVHAGYDALEGTLKAKFNLKGSMMTAQTAKELGVKYKNNRALVVAKSSADKEHLSKLLARGKNNGVEGLELIGESELKLLEPNIADAGIGALLAKTSGIICPYTLAIAAVGNAMDNGAQLRLSFEVAAIKKDKEGFTVVSAKGKKESARVVINCAGIYSDKIARMIGDTSFEIRARKGEYILLDKSSGNFVSHTLFSCPDERGKGVLITPTVDGNLLLGPTSVEIEDKDDTSIFNDSFGDIIQKAGLLCKNLPLYNTITSFAGVRAYSDRHDFIIEQSGIDRRFINVAGIESPGLTSAPAIAVYVRDMALDILGGCVKKESFEGYRRPEHFFKELSVEEKNVVIRHEPEYGKIVCRCEEITLGEILHALKANPVPQTVDGIKRRTRAGMGRCQGGFCQPSVIDEICRVFNKNHTEITKNGENSYIFTGNIK